VIDAPAIVADALVVGALERIAAQSKQLGKRS